MRRKLRGNPNLLWWYNHAGGDLGRYENLTSDCLTTTEEFTDAKISEPFKGYPVYPVYSSKFRRTCNPTQYFYPVKKRSRQRCVPTACPLPYDGPGNVPQPQIYLQDRRHSRKSLVVGPRHRVSYTATQPSPPPPLPDPIQKNQKVLVYSSTFPTQCENEQHAKLFWRKMKKYPGKGKLVSWCSQAIDSSTSADGKSVCSNYSRLSVDVTNEMEAMNRDIETILTRYESAFDNTILNELEERGLGKKKKTKPDVAVKSVPPQLTPEQQTLLAMEKPPLDRLSEIPIEYLKPRPPPSAYVKETTQETSKASGITGAAVWKGMLQDLVNRGILDKLDEGSLAKLQSALNDVSAEPQCVSLSTGNPIPMAADPSKKEDSLSGATCALRPDEKTVLSEVDKHFQPASGAKSTVNSADTRLPNLVERSEDFISVNRVNDDTNWRKKLTEIQSDRSKLLYERCNAEELNSFKRGGSGDKLCEDKSVNTDVGQNTKEDIDGSWYKNFPSGDQNSSGTQGVSEGTAGQERKSSSTTSLQDSVKEIESNITVNTMLTDRSVKANSLISGTTTCICEDLTTNPSSAVVISGEMADHLEEQELPLQRTLESTSLGNGSRSSMKSHMRRPIKPISISCQMDKSHQHGPSLTGGTRIAKHGAGDSHVMDVPSSTKDMAGSVRSVSSGIDTSSYTIDHNLAELCKNISQNSVRIHPEICLDIIGKLTELLLSNEPVASQNRNKPDITVHLKKMRALHLQHIKQEVNHIKHLDELSRQRVSCGVSMSSRAEPQER